MLVLRTSLLLVPEHLPTTLSTTKAHNKPEALVNGIGVFGGS
jgi:hypothetical protein